MKPIFTKGNKNKSPADDADLRKKKSAAISEISGNYFQMNKKTSAEKIVEHLYKDDLFSQWLGIECVEVKEGFCILRMKVRKEMLNGFKIAHGGITYSLADTALAFASNACGKMAVSIETSISHIESLKEGDVITAVAEEVSNTNKIGIYHITITNQQNKKVALFKGTVYKTSKEW